MNSTKEEKLHCAPCLKLRLKTIRMYKDIAREAFAKSLGISLRKYADCENDKKTNTLSSKELDKIISDYNIQWDWLYDNKGNIDDCKGNDSLKTAYRATYIVESIGISKEQIAHDLFIRKAHLQYIFISTRSRYKAHEKVMLTKCWENGFFLEMFCNYFKLNKTWLISGHGEIYQPIDEFESAVNKRVQDYYPDYYNPSVRSYYDMQKINQFLVKNPTVNIHWLLTGIGNQIEESYVDPLEEWAKDKRYIIFINKIKWHRLRNYLVMVIKNYKEFHTIEVDIKNEYQINDIDKWGNTAMPVTLELLLKIVGRFPINLDNIFTGRKSLYLTTPITHDTQIIQQDSTTVEIHIDEKVEEISTENFTKKEPEQATNEDKLEEQVGNNIATAAATAGAILTGASIMAPAVTTTVAFGGPITILTGGLLYLGKKLFKEEEDKKTDSKSGFMKFFSGNR